MNSRIPLIDTIREHQSGWKRACEARMPWTREAITDLKYESRKGWTPAELETFRLQNRIPTWFDIIRPMVNLVVGLEATNRSDITVLPRSPQHTAEAQAKTKLLKYETDASEMGWELTQTMRSACNTGIGWFETGLNPDAEAEKLLLQDVDAFCCYPDPNSRKPDYSDQREFYRAMWLEVQQLQLMFPDLADEIEGLVWGHEDWSAEEFGGQQNLNYSSDYSNMYGDTPPVSMWGGQTSNYGQRPAYFDDIDTHRRQLRAVERWYRKDTYTRLACLPDGRKFRVSQENARGLAELLVEGQAYLDEGLVRNIRVAMFVGNLLLGDNASPYEHREIPFTPLIAYLDDDHRPAGLVRMVRDPAKEYNTRRTHALRELMNRQLFYEKGTFADINQVADEIARPDGMIEVQPGKFDRWKYFNDMEVVQGDVQMMETARTQVTDLSGVTKELAGQESNVTAGIAIQQRQSQGQTALYTIMDNRNHALKRIGRLADSVIAQVTPMNKAVRITGGTQGLDWLMVNQYDPETGATDCDITQGNYDYAIAPTAERPTDSLSQLQMLKDFASSMPPQIQLAFAPKIAALANLPGGQDTVDQITKIADQMLTAMLPPAVGAGPLGAPAVPGGGPPAPSDPAPPGAIAPPPGAPPAPNAHPAA